MYLVKVSDMIFMAGFQVSWVVTETWPANYLQMVEPEHYEYWLHEKAQVSVTQSAERSISIIARDG